jgi:putative aldouronate transport system permease protein
VLLLYNESTYVTADIISTYVYRRGIQNAEYSFASAVGLFNSVINMTLLLSFNYVCSKLGDNRLF